MKFPFQEVIGDLCLYSNFIYFRKMHKMIFFMAALRPVCKHTQHVLCTMQMDMVVMGITRIFRTPEEVESTGPSRRSPGILEVRISLVTNLQVRYIVLIKAATNFGLYFVDRTFITHGIPRGFRKQT